MDRFPRNSFLDESKVTFSNSTTFLQSDYEQTNEANYGLRPSAHTITEKSFVDCMALGTTSDTLIDFYSMYKIKYK